jgi:alginate O-acetyltransferase complex protein AlgI
VERMVKLNGSLYIGTPAMFIYSIMAIGLLLIAEFKLEYIKNRFSIMNSNKPWVRHLSYASIILLILLFGVFDGGQFIYFQF